MRYPHLQTLELSALPNCVRVLQLQQRNEGRHATRVPRENRRFKPYRLLAGLSQDCTSSSSRSITDVSGSYRSCSLAQAGSRVPAALTELAATALLYEPTCTHAVWALQACCTGFCFPFDLWAAVKACTIIEQLSRNNVIFLPAFDLFRNLINIIVSSELRYPFLYFKYIFSYCEYIAAITLYSPVCLDKC